MKIKLIITTLVLLVSGTSGLIGWSDRPADEGAIKREEADKIMCHGYGENWFEVLVASEKTNRTQLNAMLTAYKSAIGLHQAR